MGNSDDSVSAGSVWRYVEQSRHNINSSRSRTQKSRSRANRQHHQDVGATHEYEAKPTSTTSSLKQRSSSRRTRESTRSKSRARTRIKARRTRAGSEMKLKEPLHCPDPHSASVSASMFQLDPSLALNDINDGSLAPPTPPPLPPSPTQRQQYQHMQQQQPQQQQHQQQTWSPSANFAIPPTPPMWNYSHASHDVPAAMLHAPPPVISYAPYPSPMYMSSHHNSRSRRRRRNSWSSDSSSDSSDASYRRHRREWRRERRRKKRQQRDEERQAWLRERQLQQQQPNAHPVISPMATSFDATMKTTRRTDSFDSCDVDKQQRVVRQHNSSMLVATQQVLVGSENEKQTEGDVVVVDNESANQAMQHFDGIAMQAHFLLGVEPTSPWFVRHIDDLRSCVLLCLVFDAVWPHAEVQRRTRRVPGCAKSAEFNARLLLHALRSLGIRMRVSRRLLIDTGGVVSGVEALQRGSVCAVLLQYLVQALRKRRGLSEQQLRQKQADELDLPPDMDGMRRRLRSRRIADHVKSLRSARSENHSPSGGSSVAVRRQQFLKRVNRSESPSEHLRSAREQHDKHRARRGRKPKSRTASKLKTSKTAVAASSRSTRPVKKPTASFLQKTRSRAKKVLSRTKKASARKKATRSKQAKPNPRKQATRNTRNRLSLSSRSRKASPVDIDDLPSFESNPVPPPPVPNLSSSASASEDQTAAHSNSPSATPTRRTKLRLRVNNKVSATL
ncbi:MAG: hypothetical protein MHM6MM_000073 [Cercozoa sp. M6MM]